MHREISWAVLFRCSRFLAPEEQDVYSPDLLSYPAPLGAACKVNAHITLRSAGARDYLEMRSYKHRAPPEHFVAGYQGKTTFRAKPL